MRLTLIRHGTTSWNREGRYQGWRDIPLDDTGEREAATLHTRLAAERFDAVVSSDLGRCVTTARIAFPNAIVCHDAALREIGFGVWEGHTYAECMAESPDEFSAWMIDPASVAPSNGESLHQFEDRVYAAIDALAAHANSLSHVAIVTHGGVIRALVRRLRGTSAGDAYTLPIRQCSVTRLTLPALDDSALTLDDT